MQQPEISIHPLIGRLPMIYSITETARANGLNVYYYVKHLLEGLLEIELADGSIDEKEL